MGIFEVISGLVQGLTEFVPVSSSAHMALVAYFFEQTTGAAAWSEAAANLGTLLAILAVYRGPVAALVRGSPQSLRALLARTPDLGASLVMATLITGGGGTALLILLQGDRSVSILTIGLLSVTLGIMLLLCDRYGNVSRGLSHATTLSVILMGVAQAFSVIPGVSRSGSTLTVARLLGVDRTAAYTISFLMAIPVTAGVIALSLKKAIAQGEAFAGSTFLPCCMISFIVGYGALKGMQRWLRHHTLQPFAWYRILLGFALMALYARPFLL